MNKTILWFCLFLLGCSSAEQTIPTYKVSKRDFSLVISGKGELEAFDAKVISAPGRQRQPMTIEWLQEEYTLVQKGDLVAKFDGEKVSLEMREEQLEMMLLNQDMMQKRVQQEQQQGEVGSEKQLIVKEFAFADEFTVDDIRLYSRLEIIDKMQNKDFLGAKESFLDWKEASVVEQSGSALDVINIKKQGHQSKFDQYQQSLNQLEVRAPFQGMLVYQKNWRGDKPSIGQTVWPGHAIAKIPNLEKMQAKIYVLDKEAIGLAAGQIVDFSLEAYPEQQFSGKVKEVGGFSRTVARGNPTKYFEVTVDIDDKSNSKFRPGRKLTANVQVASGEQSLLIPMQAIYNENGQVYVYLKQGGDFIQRKVTTGRKNLHFVEITKGLAEGDDIALTPIAHVAKENGLNTGKGISS